MGEYVSTKESCQTYDMQMILLLSKHREKSCETPMTKVDDARSEPKIQFLQDKDNDQLHST